MFFYFRANIFLLRVFLGSFTSSTAIFIDNLGHKKIIGGSEGVIPLVF